MQGQINPFNGTLIEIKVRHFPPAASATATSTEPTAAASGGAAPAAASSSGNAPQSKAVVQQQLQQQSAAASSIPGASPVRSGGNANGNNNGGDTTLRMLILDAPSSTNLGSYIAALQNCGVKHLVRVCAQRYRSDVVEMANIRCHAWPFEDGSPPPQNVIDQWLALLDSEIRIVGSDGRCQLVAIHCVAGLGRAPIMVAIALVEYGMFAPMDAVLHIRERRPGAINQVQLDWLMTYAPRRDRDGLLSKLSMCCHMQ